MAPALVRNKGPRNRWDWWFMFSLRFWSHTFSSIYYMGNLVCVLSPFWLKTLILTSFPTHPLLIRLMKDEVAPGRGSRIHMDDGGFLAQGLGTGPEKHTGRRREHKVSVLRRSRKGITFSLKRTILNPRFNYLYRSGILDKGVCPEHRARTFMGVG